MSRPFSRRRTPLAVVQLEDRTTPAYNLTIDGDAVTTNVTSTFSTFLKSTIFEATGPDAVLDVDDIEDTLGFGNVEIISDNAGSQSGFLHWTRSSDSDDLEYFGGETRYVYLATHSSATLGELTLSDVRMRFDGNLSVYVDTAGTGASTNPLRFDATIIGADAVQINPWHSAIPIFRGRIEAEGNIRVIADSVVIPAGGSALVRSYHGDARFDTNLIEIQGDSLSVDAREGNTIMNSAIQGPGSLVLGGSVVTLNGPVGTTSSLDGISFLSGAIESGGNPILAGTITIGDGVDESGPAIFGGTGNVTADIVVHDDGRIAPAGRFVAGTLKVLGDVDFQGGDFVPDLVQFGDKLEITGNLTIEDGSEIDGVLAWGFWTSFGERVVIEFTGTRTGTFANAPLNHPLLVGDDAVQVTRYDESAGDIAIRQAPGVVNRTYTGFEDDGTKFTVRLVGAGELVVANRPFGSDISLVVRGARRTSKLTVTTTANSSDRFLSLKRVVILSHLGSFLAPNVDVLNELHAFGMINNLTIHDFVDEIGGGRIWLGAYNDTCNLTANAIHGDIEVLGRLELRLANSMNGYVASESAGILKAKNWAGDVYSTSGIERFEVPGRFDGTINAELVKSIRAGQFAGDLQAQQVGTVNVKGRLETLTGGPGWDVTGGIELIRAGSIDGMDLTAGFIESLVVGGAGKGDGDISNSAFRITANNGDAKRNYGLKSATISGNVRSSTFDIQSGNVGSFVAGRFQSSKLFLGYDEVGLFNTGGAFSPIPGYKLGTFKTTARTIGDANNALNYAFANSQVVADRIGIVRLSGLNTISNEAFGFKFLTPPVSIRVASTSNAALPRNSDLIADDFALADQFYLIEA